MYRPLLILPTGLRKFGTLSNPLKAKVTGSVLNLTQRRTCIAEPSDRITGGGRARFRSSRFRFRLPREGPNGQGRKTQSQAGTTHRAREQQLIGASRTSSNQTVVDIWSEANQRMLKMMTDDSWLEPEIQEEQCVYTCGSFNALWLFTVFSVLFFILIDDQALLTQEVSWREPGSRISVGTGRGDM
ncbi:hypothetical protein NDU88_001313 [Pleurodeles waltl]|uniref:Uncharacterized protein n=1 Tax=Pleurodeles waltl TaxID=8319 RepID=A0AAV7NC83_PLEWA|nr:hypothetical protein NDU88_001313 [Pleurodeles waltl]